MIQAPSRPASRTVAILPWGLLYEDFLDPIGVSLEAFCEEMTGGFLFNTVEALQGENFRALIVIVSARVRRPIRMIHQGTGATVLALPAPRRMRALRGLRRSRLGRRFAALSRVAAALLEELEAYAATPCSAFVREMRREDCDVILCQEYEYPRFDVLVLLGRLLGVPVFATFQGGTGTRSVLQRAIRPLALQRAAGLVIGPRAEIERVRRKYQIAESRIARIFNPLDHDAFAATPREKARALLAIPTGARVAVWYGRVERNVKGLDVLLDAWERVCRERPADDLRLLLVGTGGDADWLRQRLERPGLRGVDWRDEYLHDRSALRLRLSAADVFVFPSRHEGFPVAPLEAMACGLPVVAADAPGIPDIFEGGERAGGLVVPRGDSEQFARALGRLLDDPAARRRLGQRARERAESRFSLEAAGRELRAFLAAEGDLGLDYRDMTGG